MSNYSIDFVEGITKQIKLAEIVITPDLKTTGFIEDSQLIIQLFVD